MDILLLQQLKEQLTSMRKKLMEMIERLRADSAAVSLDPVVAVLVAALGQVVVVAVVAAAAEEHYSVVYWQVFRVCYSELPSPLQLAVSPLQLLLYLLLLLYYFYQWQRQL